MKNIHQWKGFFKATEYVEYNEVQDVIFFNRLERKYIELYSDFFTNGISEEKLQYVNEKEYREKLDKLKKLEYVKLSYFEYPFGED